ncbi:hypothetical protein, partial [Nocardia salmonicida]|uniref:hypothetical protein n=1 Tax=Nocardia salmonicida TaxID=53431 RepID=UPI0033FE9361
GALFGVAGLEDTRADEHAFGAELHPLLAPSSPTQRRLTGDPAADRPLRGRRSSGSRVRAGNAVAAV